MRLRIVNLVTVTPSGLNINTAISLISLSVSLLSAFFLSFLFFLFFSFETSDGKRKGSGNKRKHESYSTGFPESLNFGFFSIYTPLLKVPKLFQDCSFAATGSGGEARGAGRESLRRPSLSPSAKQLLAELTDPVRKREDRTLPLGV